MGFTLSGAGSVVGSFGTAYVRAANFKVDRTEDLITRFIGPVGFTFLDPDETLDRMNSLYDQK